MEKVNSFTSSSPRVPPWSPSSHGRWALRPTRAAHSPVQMWPDLSAANFVNESSPVIDSFLLLLAMVERHCSLHRVLRSSHHWRGSVAHNASNFLKSASRLRVFVLGRTITQKFPLSSASATWSRVRLQTRFLKTCPLLLCPSRSRPSCEAKRVKYLCQQRGREI